MREREFISLEELAEIEYNKKKENLHIDMRRERNANRMTETDFEAAENAIRDVLAREDDHRMFGVYNPWYKKLNSKEQGELLTKYPKFAAMIEKDPRRLDFWNKMNNVFYGDNQ